jgi:hypothetical protein
VLLCCFECCFSSCRKLSLFYLYTSFWPLPPGTNPVAANKYNIIII